MKETEVSVVKVCRKCGQKSPEASYIGVYKAKKHYFFEPPAGVLEGKRMFRKLNWKVALIATIIIAVVNLPLHYMAYRVFYVEPFLRSYPEGLRPYIDYEPLFGSWFGTSALAVWILLTVLWAGYCVAKYKKRIKPSKTIFCAVLCLFALMFSRVHIITNTSVSEF